MSIVINPLLFAHIPSEPIVAGGFDGMENEFYENPFPSLCLVVLSRKNTKTAGSPAGARPKNKKSRLDAKEPHESLA
jgi:hypothetical protein